MASVNDLYAVQVEDIDFAAKAISKALSVTLREDYWKKRGRHYVYDDEESFEFMLLWNWNEHYEELLRPRFEDYALMLVLGGVSETLSREAEVALKAMDGVPVLLLQRTLIGGETGRPQELFAIDGGIPDVT